jgi:virginiamycin B lyase
MATSPDGIGVSCGARFRYRPSVEGLEDRLLLAVTVTEFPVPSSTVQVAAGLDGGIWFALSGGKIGRTTPSGEMTTFDVGAPLTGGMAVAPDGAIWFTSAYQIGRLAPQGSVTLYDVDTDFPELSPGLVAALDGSIWFVDREQIGRLSPVEEVTDYTLPNEHANPEGIAIGPDGNVWFTEYLGNAIGRIIPSGEITEFPLAPPESGAVSNPIGIRGIAAGPDGNLWFTEERRAEIGRIAPDGHITEFALQFPNAQPASPVTQPFAITAGPDGYMWFTDLAVNAIGRITTSGQVAEFALPAGVGIPAHQIGSSLPLGITAGPDGNIWFGESNRAAVGRVALAYTDLHITVEAQPSPVTAQSNLTYSITVTNHGASEATNVVVSDPVPIPGPSVTVSVSQGTFQHVFWGPDANGTVLSCVVAQLGTLAPGASATVAISITPFATGAFNNTVFVHASESSLVAGGESASVVTTVTAASGSTKPPPAGTTTSAAPIFMGEQRLFSRSGKKSKLIGFQLSISGPLDLGSAGTESHYQLSQPGRTRRSPSKVIPLKKVLVSPNGLFVTLNPGKFDSKKPLQLTIAGLKGSLGQAVATTAIRL